MVVGVLVGFFVGFGIQAFYPTPELPEERFGPQSHPRRIRKTRRRPKQSRRKKNAPSGLTKRKLWSTTGPPPL